MNDPAITKLFFVSTGRCGTTRISEILKQHMPDNFTILHQTSYSRKANIIGNIAYHFSIGQNYSTTLFKRLVQDEVPPNQLYISTDPLISMIIPDEVVTSPNTAIIHVIRDASGFARSMYNFTRKKRNSFIAHNFIPFWQPYLWPLENLLNKAIIDKYTFIHTKKNSFIQEKYNKNPNYQFIDMDILLSQGTLARLINTFWNLDISIPDSDLRKKTNKSTS